MIDWTWQVVGLLGKADALANAHIEPDMRISLHPALGQDLTPSPMARRA
jgi:hypothetical protein